VLPELRRRGAELELEAVARLACRGLGLDGGTVSGEPLNGAVTRA
jgi:hypothetical protein